jgi:thymidylate kinase
MLEQPFGEKRRRTKVVPHAFGQRAVLKLMYASFDPRQSNVATRRHQRSNAFERRQINELRNELEESFTEQTASTLTTASRRRLIQQE